MRPMRSLTAYFKDKQRAIVLIFFAVYLITGLAIVKDYGVSWDELPYRSTWLNILKAENYDHRFLTLRTLQFQPFMLFIEKGFDLTDSYQAIMMRHVATFVFFYMSMLVFYALCKRRFGSRMLALLGVAFVVLSPRLFGHSFYNPKDIPTFAYFLFGVFTLTMFLEKKSVMWAIAHTVMCLTLTEVHRVGLLVVFFTVIFYSADLVTAKARGERVMPRAAAFLLYLNLFVFFIFRYKGGFYFNPLTYLHESVTNYINFEYSDPVLYMGHWFKPREIPWHYNIVWMAISAPLVYLPLFLIGFAGAAAAFVRHPLAFYQRRKEDIIYAAWLIIPLAVPMCCNVPMYDSWRHHYFVYPAAIMFTLMGVRVVWRFLSSFPDGAARTALRTCFAGIIAVNLAGVLFFMVRAHPFQDLYFNQLTGGIKGAQGRFDLDYWGISYRKGYEYIVEHDKNNLIVISVDNFAGRANSYLLPYEERSRLWIVNYPPEKEYSVDFEGITIKRKAKYFLTNYRWARENCDYPELYAVKVDGVRLMSVCSYK